MLGIGKLAVGAETYYLAISAGIEDYYAGMASPGQWIASVSVRSGLEATLPQKPHVISQLVVARSARVHHCARGVWRTGCMDPYARIAELEAGGLVA